MNSEDFLDIEDKFREYIRAEKREKYLNQLILLKVKVMDALSKKELYQHDIDFVDKLFYHEIICSYDDAYEQAVLILSLYVESIIKNSMEEQFVE